MRHLGWVLHGVFMALPEHCKVFPCQLLFFFALSSLLYHGISGHGWDDKVLLATVAGPPVKQERQKIPCDILVAIPSRKWVEIQREINTKATVKLS